MNAVHNLLKKKFFFRFAGNNMPGLCHLITTRLGGISAKPYESLNLSFHVGDNPCAVLKNREFALRELGDYPLESLVTMEQCHTANIRVIRDTSFTEEIKNTDGLVTDVTNIVLCAMSADCPLCLFYDPVRKVTALAHSGWRGTYANICSGIITAMDGLGCRRKNIIAGIGPCICGSCYRVSSDLWRKFDEKYGIGDGRAFTLDLAKIIRSQLINERIPESNIETAGICTACNPRIFYSYRRDAKITGRFGLFAVME